jgi:hypothetical protein
MKCPVCKEATLTMTERQGFEIDYCPFLLAIAAPSESDLRPVQGSTLKVQSRKRSSLHVAQLGPGDLRMDAAAKRRAILHLQGWKRVAVCNPDPNFQVWEPKTWTSRPARWQKAYGEDASYSTDYESDLRFRAREGRLTRWRRATVFQNWSCDTPLPALMLFRDLLSKDCKRREWANISRS